ncbi:MAG: hypothetical protein VZQ62_01060 [Methanosphaera sp.]|nr:hypothetical protein [Methanosphaera sp.]
MTNDVNKYLEEVVEHVRDLKDILDMIRINPLIKQTTEDINNSLNEFISSMSQLSSINEIDKLDERFKKLNTDVVNTLEDINKTFNLGQDFGMYRNTPNIDIQSVKNREQALREEQSIRSKLEKQAQTESEQLLKKTESKVREVCGTVVNTIKKTISNIIGVIRKLNTLLNKSINFIISGFRGAFNTIKRLLTLFGNFGNRVKTISHNGNILKGTFTELKSKVELLVGAFKSLFNNEFLRNGMKLLSSIQTLNMLIGKDLTAKTIDWANNLEKGFGLSASGLIQNLQSVSSVLYGMGMSSENVYNAGRNLEALGMTMSSITGLDFDTVIEKIDSGMKGMTQSIDDLGLSVRESQMDAFLQKLKAQGGEYANIGTKFSNLTENQRVYVRYAAIMDQFMSKEAFSAEAYAKSLNTLTGQMSILKQQIQQLKSTIGLLVLKLFAQVIKPLTYIVYLANLAVRKIAALFGISLDLDNTINEIGGGGIDTSGVDGLNDSLEETADAAEEAKAGLAGVDNVTSLNTSKSGGKGKDDFDYSKLANYNDNYADMLEELGKMNDDYIEQCKQALIKMLKDMENRIGDWFKKLTGRIIDWDIVEANFGKAWENIKNTAKNLKDIFKNVFDIIGGLFGSFLDDLDFSTLFEKFTRVISLLTKIGSIITKKLQPYIQKFYDDYLSPYVVKFGDWLEEHLDKWIEKTEEWLTGWESDKYDDTLKDFFENTLPEKFNSFVENIQKAKDKIIEFKNLIKGEDSDKTFIDVIKEKFEFIKDNVLTPIGDILSGLFVNLFDKNNDGVVNLEDTKISLDKIKEKIEKIGDYLSEHKDEIVDLLNSAVNFIVKLGQIKIEVFEMLFAFLIEHADTIKAICNKVIEMIDYAIAHPALSISLAIEAGAAYGAINLIFEYFKQKFKATILKKVLGLDKGGEIEKAGKSVVNDVFDKVNTKTDDVLSKLKGPINTVMNVSIVLIGLTALATIIGSVFKMGWDMFTDGIRGFKINTGGLNQLKIKDEAYAAADAMRQLGDTSDETKQKLIDNFAKNASALATNEKAAEAAIEQYKRSLEDGLSNHPLTKLWIDLQDALHWNEQKASIERNKQFITGSYDEISNQVTGSLDEISLSADNNISSLDELIGTYEGLNTTSESVVANNSNVKMSFDELVNANASAAQSEQEHKNIISELREQINKDLAEIGTVSESTNSKLNNMAKSIGADFISIRLKVNNVTDAFNKLNQTLQNLTSRQWKVDFRDGTSISNTKWASESRTKIKGLGFANGGVPKSGSLFFANENGNPELVGNFGGYSGVANQDMIIQAIKEAAVQNSNGSGIVINNNFNIGYMLGTKADFRDFVNKITQVQKQQSYNIANGNFIMT